jgi:hypothetical protein
MELCPIPGVRAVGPTTVSRDEREVQPPYAVDPAGRMGDDAYNGARQETERELKEESPEVAVEADSTPPDSSSDSSDSESRVNLFA